MQHVGQGFPLDWFTHTFNRLSVAMSFLAVTLGPALMAAHDFAGGNLGPFKISLILTVISALFLLSWRRDTNKPCPACADTGRLLSLAASALTAGDKVALISAAQGCFEAASFAFSMLWTPLITSVAKDVEELPWGLAFSQQLVCVMIGSALFKLVTALSPGTTAERMCVVASAGGAFCFFTIAMGPTLSGMQCALLGFEVCAGIYLNAMGVMRSKYIPQEVRCGVGRGGGKTRSRFDLLEGTCTWVSLLRLRAIGGALQGRVAKTRLRFDLLEGTYTWVSLLRFKA